jgi:hypothetical protein
MNDRGAGFHTDSISPGDDARPHDRATDTGQEGHVEIGSLFHTVDQRITAPVKAVRPRPIVIRDGDNVEFLGTMSVNVFYHAQCCAGMAAATKKNKFTHANPRPPECGKASTASTKSKPKTLTRLTALSTRP